MTPRTARKILTVTAAANAEEIRSAYRRLALVAHPDQGGSPERFIALKAAHDLLLQLTPLANAPMRPAAGGGFWGDLERRQRAAEQRLHDIERGLIEPAITIDGRGRIRRYWRRPRKS